MIDDPRSTACAPGLRQEIYRLRALPGIAAAESRIATSYAQQIGQLVNHLHTGLADAQNASLLRQLAVLCS